MNQRGDEWISGVPHQTLPTMLCDLHEDHQNRCHQNLIVETEIVRGVGKAVDERGQLVRLDAHRVKNLGSRVTQRI